jgi:hypothetical protein
MVLPTGSGVALFKTAAHDGQVTLVMGMTLLSADHSLLAPRKRVDPGIVSDP